MMGDESGVGRPIERMTLGGPKFSVSGRAHEGRGIMTVLYFDGRPNHTTVGYFTYTVDDDHWLWSDGMYALHGYAPDAVKPTTALVLRHKHPDDANRAFQVLETVVKDAQPFSCYHRIINVSGEVRCVLSVGRGHIGSNARVEQVSGFFVDLTEVVPPPEPALLGKVGDARSRADRVRPVARLRPIRS
jgi:hypothetical protein